MEKNNNKIGIAKFWGWQARAISMGSMTIVMGYLSMFLFGYNRFGANRIKLYN